MNEQRLKIYLEDHLAMNIAETELVARCHDKNRRSDLGSFLSRLRSDNLGQRSTIEDVLEFLGHQGSLTGRFKMSVAWFAEKLGRFKVNDSLLHYSDLSRVVELEALAASIQERISLWETMEMIGPEDPRFSTCPFETLRKQSEQHLIELRHLRKTAAAEAFLGSSLTTH